MDRPRRYWAGGFTWGSGSQLDLFLGGSYWRHGFKRGDSSKRATTAWNHFDQIEVGDWFAIKGLGGQNKLNIHFVGEVTSIDSATARLELRALDVTLYAGDGPTGKGAGNWHGTLFPVERADLIEMVFGVDPGCPLLRPELALRGFDLTERHWDAIAPREGDYREQTIPQANAALQADQIAADPLASLDAAVRASKNLLSQFEKMHALSWIKRASVVEAQTLLRALLLDEAPLTERVARAQELAGKRENEEGHPEGFTITALSYLLAMHDPDGYAFIKPKTAFLPAAHLLLLASGHPKPVIDGPGRVSTARALYGQLRDLWKRERGFEGDLFDVHTRVYVLGRGYLDGCTWIDALRERPQELLDRVALFEQTHPEFPGELESAVTLARTVIDPDRPDDPFHALALDDYAYGQDRPSLCRIVEHNTKQFIRVGLGNASAHEVGLAKDGTWRLSRDAGHSREDAERRFEESVKPRLREIAAAAQAFVRGEDIPELSAPKLGTYRSLDGKTFALVVAVLDPTMCYQSFVPILNPAQVQGVARLLGVDPRTIGSFRDYVVLMAELRARLDELRPGDRPSAYGLGAWLYHSDSGKLVARFARSAFPDDESPDADPAVSPPTDGVSPPQGGEDERNGERYDWDILFESLDEDECTVAALLRRRLNVVLYGPPGTGKTWTSHRIATAWREWTSSATVEADVVQQVTFHPSYGYEDFIEAYRPDPSRSGAFELTDGPLPRMARAAAEHPEVPHLLLIDEINRGDVARILGELITLLEFDKRGEAYARRRMLSRKPLHLPSNLHVLGTMNTADKSVSLMDVAVRRRFAFVPMTPRSDLFGPATGVVAEVSGVPMRRLLERLNDRLLGIGVLPDRLIGHALLFIRDDTDDARQDLVDRFRWDLIPLVEEYCFSDRRSMKKVLGRLVNDHGQPRSAVLDDESRFAEALQWIVSAE